MVLIDIVITLIVVGLLLWLVEKFVPLDPAIRQIIRAVVIIAVVLWLCYTLLGLTHGHALLR